MISKFAMMLDRFVFPIYLCLFIAGFVALILFDIFDAPAQKREAHQRIEAARELIPNKHGQYAEKLHISIPQWMEKYPDRKIIALCHPTYGQVTVVYELVEGLENGSP